MTITELRGVEHPINWYPPMAQSTYMGMTKRDLVGHLAVAYYNWLEAERANVRVTSYAKKKCDQADKAMYAILPALDISLDAVASAHNTEYGDDPEFDRLYRIVGEVKRRYACETPYNDQLEEARSEIVRLGKLVEEFADKVEIQAKKARKATRELRKAKKQLEKAEEPKTDEVTISRKDFDVMMDALCDAWMHRAAQCHNIEGRDIPKELHEDWSNDFERWFDLYNRLRGEVG